MIGTDSKFLTYQDDLYPKCDLVDNKIIAIINADDLFAVRWGAEGRCSGFNGYKLNADIDLAESIYSENWDSIDIGVRGSTSAITFDGNDKVIKNMVINDGLESKIDHYLTSAIIHSKVTYTGLFGLVEDNVTIQNLGIVNANVNNNVDRVDANIISNMVGILAGWGRGRFQNVFTTGLISSFKADEVGGIVGLLDNSKSLLRNSWSNAVITIDSPDTKKQNITQSPNCEPAANATCKKNQDGSDKYSKYGGKKYTDTTSTHTGGLVGYAIHGTSSIEDNYYIGNITAISEYIGGIVGRNNNTAPNKIRRNYFAGEIKGNYQNNEKDYLFGRYSDDERVKSKPAFIGGIAGIWEGAVLDLYTGAGTNRRNVYLTYSKTFDNYLENGNKTSSSSVESIYYIDGKGGVTNASSTQTDIKTFGLRICEMVKNNGKLSQIINVVSDPNDKYNNYGIKHFNFLFSSSNDTLPYVCKLKGSGPASTDCQNDNDITGGKWQVEAIDKWVKNVDKSYKGPTTCVP